MYYFSVHFPLNCSLRSNIVYFIITTIINVYVPCLHGLYHFLRKTSKHFCLYLGPCWLSFLSFSSIRHTKFNAIFKVTVILTAKKMKFSIKDLFSKCDQILRKLRISSHLLKNSLMENFILLCSDSSATDILKVTRL